MVSQEARVVVPNSITASVRASVMVPVIQVCTTQSMRAQSGELGAAASERTWLSKE